MAKEKIKVWKLEIFDSWIIFGSLNDLISSLECELEDISEPEDIVISPVFMTQDEYEKLPEFDGH